MKIFLLSVFIISFSSATLVDQSTDGIGVNWGTMMSHPILPTAVVDMLRANGIRKVKLFDADSWTVEALGGTGIEVMLAIPNDQLMMLNEYRHAREWVKKNVTRYLGKRRRVNIKYVAVGNEPFLGSYNGTFTDITYPALRNIQKALDEAGVGRRIKATVPLNADVYNSPPHKPVPSAGNFRSDIHGLMVKIVRYLHSTGAPFVVNIYPFLSLYDDDKFPINYAFFDGAAKPLIDNGIEYTNMFDANFDTLIWALRKAGVPDLKVIVGEVGWPTDGHRHANVASAMRFYNGLLKKLAKKVGTPLRPGKIEVYVFGLVDEDMKSILPGNFERHWGIFRYDGNPKFPMDLTGRGHDRGLIPVKGVKYLSDQWCVFNDEARDLGSMSESMKYACSLGDCTVLGYGASCNHLDSDGNVSYAFNMYYQMQDQDVRACDFGGLAKITAKNASRRGCLFPVQIVSAAGRRIAAVKFMAVMLMAGLLLCGFNTDRIDGY